MIFVRIHRFSPRAAQSKITKKYPRILSLTLVVLEACDCLPTRAVNDQSAKLDSG
jgi:hypothetical protein